MKPENQPNELKKGLDIIIVGAGAAGAAAAWRLAAGGLKVACLERGDWQKDGTNPYQQKLLKGGLAAHRPHLVV